MSCYSAEILWERGDQDFKSGRYSRRHRLRFDGGAGVLVALRRAAALVGPGRSRP